MPPVAERERASQSARRLLRQLCLVMELVEGGELFDYLMDHGPFGEDDARSIMMQLLQARIVRSTLSLRGQPP